MPKPNKHTDHQARYADQVYQVVDGLRAIRRSKNLSQREISRRLGVSQAQTHYLESHISEPRLSTLFALADALGVTIKITLEVNENG